MINAGLDAALARQIGSKRGDGADPAPRRLLKRACNVEVHLPALPFALPCLPAQVSTYFRASRPLTADHGGAHVVVPLPACYMPAALALLEWAGGRQRASIYAGALYFSPLLWVWMAFYGGRGLADGMVL